MAVLQVALGLAYPALIYFSLSATEPRWLALGVLSLLAARVAVASPGRALDHARALGLPVLAVGVAMLVSLVWNDPLALLATPALVSFSLLIVFARSLGRPESTVEAFARAQLDVLSDEQVAYCRRVTVVWCGFFLLNGAVALHLAAAATRAEWAIYTGFIAYLAMGALFACEFVYRHWRFRVYAGAPFDALLRRIFPPRLQ